MSGFASDRQLIERVLIPATMGVIVASMKRLAESGGEGDLPVLDRVGVAACRRSIRGSFQSRIG